MCGSGGSGPAVRAVENEAGKGKAAPAAPNSAQPTNTDAPAMDKSVNALNKKGRSKLRIDKNQTAATEGSGLNIPQ